MRIHHSLPIAAAALALLSGCGGTSLFNRDRPDEMAVTRQPPLVIPPDFSLKPPAPGTAASQQSNIQREALDTMFGGPAPRSSGETSLLDEAGEQNSMLGIRSSVADGETEVLDKGRTVFDIVAAPEGDGQSARASLGQPQG
ncbi:MAG TPA: DUF3035 domain-containing protein [Sphingobium sp.]|nr:DUF3035 domain-containing protein [Sphingobium sp.]